MINFFIQPYSGELFYSILSRYDYYSGNRGSFETLKTLYGTLNKTVNILLPHGLDYLTNIIFKSISYNSELLIEKHTVLPIFYPFIDKEKKQNIISNAKNNSSNTISSLLGLQSIYNVSNKELMYCPLCVCEEADTYGEAYFHTIHQMQGVLICPKHECILNKYPIQQKDVPLKNFIRLDLNKVIMSPEFIKDKKQLYLIKSIAESIEYIINKNFMDLSIEQIQRTYLKTLKHRGYITEKDRIKYLKVIDDIKSYFGDDILELLGINCDIRGYYRWIKGIIKEEHRVYSPLQHILFILMLYKDIDKFFTDVISNSNSNVFHEEFFGKGPWPCLNPVASHYRQFVVRKCNITQHYCILYIISRPKFN